MNSKYRKTLIALFAEAVRSGIFWAERASLFLACDGEGRGSLVRVELNGVLATFDRRHLHPTVDKGAVKSVRRFLENAGVKL